MAADLATDVVTDSSYQPIEETALETPLSFPDIFKATETWPAKNSASSASSANEVSPEVETILTGFNITDQPQSAADGPPETIEELATKYGVHYQTTVVNGQTVYTFYKGQMDRIGPETPLLETTGSISEIDAQLAAVREQKIKDIEQKYNVTLSRDGQSYDVDGQNVPLKAPTFDQLEDVEKALRASVPSLQSQDGTPIAILFATDNISDSNWGIYLESDHPALLVEPRATFLLSELITHELAHAAQDRLAPGTDSSVTVNASGILADYYAALGYTKVTHVNADGSETDEWILKTKDGAYYKPVGDDRTNPYWLLVDEQGNPIHLDGLQESVADQKLTNEEMMRRALVTPSSTYFIYPWESGAEALMQLRLDEAHRHKLIQASPELYELTKQLDQEDINLAYGVKEDGSPRYVRMPDGRILPNTAITQAVIAEWERTNRIPDPEPGPGTRPDHPIPPPHDKD